MQLVDIYVRITLKKWEGDFVYLFIGGSMSSLQFVQILVSRSRWTKSFFFQAKHFSESTIRIGLFA